MTDLWFKAVAIYAGSVASAFAWILRDGIRRLTARFRKPKRRPDHCAVCRVELAPKKAHELRDYPNDDLLAEFGMGGSYMSETYCAKHCPGGCERHCRPVA